MTKGPVDSPTPIVDAVLPDAIHAGIGMGLAVPDMIPLFEEHDARVQAGYTLAAWSAIHYSERAYEIAHYRLRAIVRNHQKAAESSVMKSRMNKGKGRKK